MRLMMTRRIAGTAAVVLALIGTVVCAAEEREYWREIQAHTEAAREAGLVESPEGQAFYAYFEALTPEEMIIAGRQVSLRIMEAYGSSGWQRNAMALWWFYQFYPGKTDGLRDIEPLLAEIADAEAPAYWRWFLEHLFTYGWDAQGRLIDEQRREVVGRLFGVLERKDEHEMVRAEAVVGIPRLLVGLQKALPPAGGQEEPQEDREKLASLGRRYAQLAADLVGQKTASPDLLRKALAGLVRVHNISLAGSETAVPAVGEAAREYRAYPESIWPQLMLSAIEMNAAPNLSGLLADARTAAQEEETTKRLIALQTLAANRRISAETPAQGGTPTPGLRRLSDCTEGELLAMAHRRADRLAAGLATDNAWGQLGAILQEYEKRAD